jgi:hypothetical protein
VLFRSGQIVTQSDLTFATNTSVIIAEVQHNLMALGLVKSEVGVINADMLDTIATSVNYLDSNDIVENDLNIDKSAKDSAATAQALNISTFIDQIPGGKAFKQKSNTVTSAYSSNAKEQVSKQASRVSGSIK